MPPNSALGVQPPERREQPPDPGHVEAHPVVADEEHRSSPSRIAPSSIRGEAHREVNFQALPSRLLEQHPHQPAVGVDHQAGRDLDADAPSRLVARELLDAGRASADEIDAMARDRRAADPRELEQRIDQIRHPRRRGEHAPEVIARPVVELVAELLEERVGERADRAQRRPQIVRDRVAERLELAVGLGELDVRPRRAPRPSRARLGELARRARLGGLELAAQQLLADGALLVLDLLAADLRLDARGQHVEAARPSRRSRRRPRRAPRSRRRAGRSRSG